MYYNYCLLQLLYVMLLCVLCCVKGGSHFTYLICSYFQCLDANTFKHILHCLLYNPKCKM